MIGKGGVEGIDPTYARLRDVLEKSQFLLDEDDDHKCSICAENIDVHKNLFVVCPNDICQDTSHVTCLGGKSLEAEHSSGMVPETGTCPTCKHSQSWPDLMQQVTVRARGVKEMRKILARKSKGQAAIAAEILETESEDDDEIEHSTLTARDVIDENFGLSDDDDDDDDDNLSVASADSALSRTSDQVAESKQGDKQSRHEMVIEDSEDEG